MNVYKDEQRKRILHDADGIRNQKIIVPSFSKGTWLRAWKYSAELEKPTLYNLQNNLINGLPDHKLLDEYLASEDFNHIKDAFPLWSRNILAYPKINGRFLAGSDIIDRQTRFGIPFESIKHLDVFKPGVALFIDPLEVKTAETIWIIPKTIRVLENITQVAYSLTGSFYLPSSTNHNIKGRADGETAIPTLSTINQEIKPSDERFLARVSEIGVRPISRAIVHGFRNMVYADEDLEDQCGVSFVLNRNSQIMFS